MEVRKFSTRLGGADLVIEVGRLAGMATGSCLVSHGETVILATCTVAAEPREGIDFFPLLIDFEERFYAAGKISGSRWVKREGRPSEEAVLTARLIDRPLRPLFPKDFKNDVQVILTVLSYDGQHSPDIPAIIGASAATLLSGAPFKGPVGAARVGKIEGKLTGNPTIPDMGKSDLDLVVAGTSGRVMMLEGDAAELSEDEVTAAIEFGLKELTGSLSLQEEMVQAFKIKPLEVAEVTSELDEKVGEYLGKKLAKAARIDDREKKAAELAEFEKGVMENFEGSYKQIDLKSSFDRLLEKEVRVAILEDKKRPDGRKVDEIRPLSAEVGLLPRTHGSALFTRGQTQALSVLTLGSPGEEQLIETMETEGTKRFMHHYVFPPYSTGEVKPLRTASRRDIGHGYLVERSLARMIPPKDLFPYTIRVVSEILSSNGSTSMASVCASTLALMDGGVPIQSPVAGIAIGLITKEKTLSRKGEYILLTDIQGIEDFAGDMDFKVAGTKKGVTGIQVDIKIDGLTLPVIREAFDRAKKARGEILSLIEKTLPKPRGGLSKHAPRVEIVSINPDKIRDVIGPGGKVINRIINEAGGPAITTIDIEDDGRVIVSSMSSEAMEKAMSWIKNLTREAKVGEVFKGRVTRIMNFGAFVELWPGTEGMVHISQLKPYRVERVTDVVKAGDVVPVKVIEIDEKGRINLSMKEVDQTPKT
jgi:polyribonucleotide nucleotidyltransferase